ncbi:hypothetical protein MAP00_001741 [Monascus purpureus]|nr:hypothetical protein MAP00_001741 [Monascus purpureus]
MMASGQRSTDSVSAGDHARAPGLQSPPQTAKHGPRGATAQASFRPNRTPSTGNPVTWVPSTAPRRGSNVALPGGGNRPAAAARRTPGHGAPRQFDRRGWLAVPVPEVSPAMRDRITTRHRETAHLAGKKCGRATVRPGVTMALDPQGDPRPHRSTGP